MKIVNKITPGLFDNIIAYTVAEPGAMGFSNSMEIVDDKGKYFVISFDEIPFASVKNFSLRLPTAFLMVQCPVRLSKMEKL